MNARHADLCVFNAGKAMADELSRLGWGSACFAREFSDAGSFKKFAEEVRGMKSEIASYAAAIITSGVSENARKALEHADLIIVEARTEEDFRQASESYDVDIILGAEKYIERDMMDFRASGLDHVMMKFMGERKTAYGVKFSDILNSYGARRIQLLGRIRQNIQMAMKYKVPVVAVSGASSEYELKTPQELESFLLFLSTEEAAKKSVADNPLKLLSKAEDRKNPDIVTSGVKVVDWGSQQKKQKRKFGWY